jgi:sucrose-phosphate synthase
MEGEIMGKENLYIQLFSVQGLLRGGNLEMGRNADTGGQVKYVVELAKALGEHEGVRKVDLFTRRIRGKEFSPDYNQHIEQISDKVRIVRIQCGGTRYLRKELLWPHLDEFVDKTLKFTKDEGQLPDVLHGHYADAGYVVMELSSFLGIPFVFTGHSLGRPKKHRLSGAGFSDEEMNKQFHIDHRIDIEEEVIKRAYFIITSTNQEIEKQYGMYDFGKAAQFHTIPPGIDTGSFYPFYEDAPADPEVVENIKQAQFFMQKELERFLTIPEKPLILTISRPDRRKNISGLATAYGMDKELQAIANLAIFAGIRKDINLMDDNEREVLTELLLSMDKYDLYGKLAIPKRHDFEYEIPELYRIAARRQGVFVNPAFTEPFGLTLVESASCGLPIVATDDGGPRDIIKNCNNGLLIDVHNYEETSAAIKNVLVDPDRWREFSHNGIVGVKNHYSWDAHCGKYLTRLAELPPRELTKPDKTTASSAIGRRFSRLNKLFITDIDDTFLGDDEAVTRLAGVIRENREHFGFGFATGRPIDTVTPITGEYELPHPDVILSSVGTEIYYGEQLMPDRGWQTHIASQWQPEKTKNVLQKLPFLNPQDEDAERKFKISYYMEESAENLAKVHQVLSEKRLRYTLIYSRGMFLDILPARASKGKAIRYLSYKWNIPLGNILVSGDSDNDEDMLRGEMLGVVVGNHHPDLDKLRGLKNVYFAKANHAAGILEGFENYGFI